MIMTMMTYSSHLFNYNYNLSLQSEVQSRNLKLLNSLPTAETLIWHSHTWYMSRLLE